MQRAVIVMQFGLTISQIENSSIKRQTDIWMLE